ncbi:MAG: hypothetical protein ACE5FD_01530 [Anaerolineae bacterium]
MQEKQQFTGTRQVSDKALTEAVQEALMMAEFFDQIAQGSETPDVKDAQLAAQLQVAHKQMREVTGIDEFEIQIEAKGGRPV